MAKFLVSDVNLFKVVGAYKKVAEIPQVEQPQEIAAPDFVDKFDKDNNLIADDFCEAPEI